MENLQQLQKLAQIFNADKIITPEEINQVREILIGVLANNKKELTNLTEETKQLLESVLEKISEEHDTYLNKTEKIAQELKSDTTEAIQATMKSLEEVKNLCKEVMDCKPENGKDADEEYVISEVLNRIKLPEYKEVVLDDGLAIVDKINSLPVNEENQIDAKHIKNLPETKTRTISGGVTRKIVEQMIAAAGGGGTPGGSDTQVQFNDGGSFGGDAGLTYNKTTDTLTIAGGLVVDTNTLVVDSTNHRTGLLTTAPTHTLTLGSTSTGISLYNTSDQTTNYERGVLEWNTNVLKLGTTAGGTGTVRSMQIYTTTGGGTSSATFNRATATGMLTITHAGSPTAGLVANLFSGGNWTASSGTQTFLSLTPTINQSSTAGYTALLINPTETNTGSGTKNLLQLQAGGTNRFRVDNIGNTILSSAATSGFQVFNTSDETTNYDKFQAKWSSNVFYLSNTAGGTGSARAIRLGTVAAAGTDLPVNYLEVSHSSSGGIFKLISGSFGGSDFLKTTTTVTSSSTVQNIFNIAFTANQSSTGGYIGLLINATETTTGSGTKLLADFQVGGTSRFSVANTGSTTISGTPGSSTAFTGLTIQNTSSGIGANTIISLRAASISTGRAEIHAVAPGSSDTELAFYTSDNNAAATEKVRIDDVGNVGIGVTAPTADLHIKAGVATAEGAPLKFTSGTNLTTPENGAMEYDGTSLYFTPSSATRRTVVLDTATQTLTNKSIVASQITTGTFGTGAYTMDTRLTVPQILNTPATITVTTNAGTVTRANRINNFTNSSAAAMTITMSTTSATDGDIVMVSILDFSAVAQTITWVNTENSDVSVPATSNGSTTLPRTVGFKWNSATSKWRCMMNI